MANSTGPGHHLQDYHCSKHVLKYGAAAKIECEYTVVDVKASIVQTSTSNLHISMVRLHMAKEF